MLVVGETLVHNLLFIVITQVDLKGEQVEPTALNDQAEKVVEHFPVAVILERLEAKSQWVDYVWSAVGVTVGSQDHLPRREAQLVHEEEGVQHYLYGGLQVALYVDQCESYYHNMMTETPRCYIVAYDAEESGTGMPEPFLVTMSFDEAHCYLEAEGEVYSVDVPPELYRWTEDYVLAHYVAEKKKKRKLVDWKKQGRERAS
ncbi:DUF3305 domain-containing protein [Solemya velum gill symbiont]|uniref:DUF3305 domain-containing protein n=1 Tax=Solemya velum gill symbiont TaxID=2340 RepID=UPI0009987C04|nr:DUF3305 domain-containing protein [Solemya velum gill symbiont]OOY99289.1 hypothetical protein BOW19_05120 [Solemya velum gill symbiont]OOZ01462.1 hypothetical protein BOW20_05120 [Solemya velum gill symbiont]OOZ03785.1 hypothetical protein BOW21_05110 [Solemya velum gill symbiont]OOZ06014.1 hypothetical protein BOW22_05095 [Solemya velum gill symbiont]OOZ08234.1 hypothetical protein BOW23_05090 [Solemya velum gill symbiont]